MNKADLVNEVAYVVSTKTEAQRLVARSMTATKYTKPERIRM